MVSIGFGFGPDFATPKSDIRKGFDRIATGLVIPTAAKKRLHRAFEAGHRSGDTRQERELVAAALTGVKWRWPWMEECAANFERLGIWPTLWPHLLVIPPLLWNESMEDAKQELLRLTLTSATFQARDMRIFIELDNGPVSYLKLATSGMDCAVERMFFAAHADRIEAGDYQHLPPYFPGCGLRTKMAVRRDAIRW